MIRFGIYKDRVFVFHAYKRIHLTLNLLYIRIFLQKLDIHGIPSQILVCRLFLVQKKLVTKRTGKVDKIILDIVTSVNGDLVSISDLMLLM